MKKILVFGFKPYKNFKKNTSEEIIKKINIKDKVILTVKFGSSIVVNKIKKIKPDFIIGFGQSRKGKLLRIERTAKFKGKKQNVNLKLKKINGTRISYNAGEYVCNNIMYSIIDYINKNKLKTKFAFIHIPRNLNINKSLKVIKKILKNEIQK